MTTTRFPTLYILLIIIIPLALAIAGSIFIRRFEEFVIGFCFYAASILFLFMFLLSQYEKWIIPFLVLIFGIMNLLFFLKGIIYLTLPIFFLFALFFLSYLPPVSRIRHFFKKS